MWNKRQVGRPVFARRMAVWCLLALLPLAAARAGDEEMNPSVYQIFDPETGYFIDVEPPPDAQQSTNSQQSTTPAPADPQPADNAMVAAAPGQAAPVSAPAPDRRPLLIAGIAILLVLVAGFVWRKKGS